MGETCGCKYKCSKVDIIFDPSEVDKGDSFKVTVKPYGVLIDAEENKSTPEPYTPTSAFKLSASDGVSFNSGSATINEDEDTVTYTGCSIDSNPPNNALSTSITITVQDPETPGAGECGSKPITLKGVYTPSGSKRCSGPGDGSYGSLEMTNGSDWLDGADVDYYGYTIGHADYGKDATFGPMACPYGNDYCTDAVWTVTWS